MSYYMICPNCGKGTMGRYATDNNLCGECSDNSSTTDKLSVEKLQEQLNTAKKALTEEIESIEKYLDKYGMSSYGANTRQAYLEGLKKALAAIEKGENNEI